MLNQNLFQNGKIEYQDQVEKVFFTLAQMSDENNVILKVDNLEEASKNTRHIVPAAEAVAISTIISKSESKNVFLVNEAYDDNLKNLNTGLMDNFYKLYFGLTKILPKYVDKKDADVNVSIVNMQCPIIHHDSPLAAALYLESKETKNDVAILRNFGSVNIFVPADSVEADYLLRVVEKNLGRKERNTFSYLKLQSEASPKIFSEDFFIKDGNLKEWTGLPEIVYISKNLDSAFEVAIIASGPILYNALLAAKELEDRNYKVTVLNISLIQSNSEFINQKIATFINNFADTHKNIITIEEHSKVGGLGSLVCESVAQNTNRQAIRVERLGHGDNLSPRNIIAKCEEIVGF